MTDISDVCGFQYIVSYSWIFQHTFTNDTYALRKRKWKWRWRWKWHKELCQLNCEWNDMKQQRHNNYRVTHTQTEIQCQGKHWYIQFHEEFRQFSLLLLWERFGNACMTCVWLMCTIMFKFQLFKMYRLSKYSQADRMNFYSISILPIQTELVVWRWMYCDRSKNILVRNCVF